MDLVIANKSEKPIYEQIYEQIAAQIIVGALPPGFALPSIRNVALELNISIITIKKAWELLENAGYIYTRGGKGCYVCELASKDLKDLKLKFIEERCHELVDYCKDLKIPYEELVSILKKEFHE